MLTNVYIDGFNFFYGVVKGSPHKWLDIAQLCSIMLPNNQIHQIKYYTALVSARPHDMDKPIRQQTYLRALRTLPDVSVILGHFLTHPVSMQLVNPPATGSPYVQVIKTEEKGSDVNMATHLLWDGVQNNYDIAVVLSNDSDLLEPIKIVRKELNKKVGVMNPHSHPSRELLRNSDFYKRIRPSVLPLCQFPPTLTDEQGTFHKPAGW